MSIGQRLKNAIKSSGYTQKEISNKLDISANSLSNYINEKREPKISILTKITSMLDINLDWLLTGDGPMYKSDIKKAPGDTGGQVKDRSISHISSQEAKISRELDRLIEKYQEEKEELRKLRKSIDKMNKKYKTILVKLQKLDDEDLKTIDKLIDKFLD